MKKLLASLVLVLVCAGPVMADALDSFLDNLNVQAVADRNGFAVQLGSHFGRPRTDVDLVIDSVSRLSDAFLILQLGRMTGLPTHRVLTEYRASHGQGWGVLAKRLGIKPGSKAFHRLKQGEFDFTMPRKAGKKQSGNGQGQGKDHGQGNGKHGKKNK